MIIEDQHLRHISYCEQKCKMIHQILFPLSSLVMLNLQQVFHATAVTNQFVFIQYYGSYLSYRLICSNFCISLQKKTNLVVSTVARI